MRDILVQIISVLTQHIGLTEIVDPANISATVREPVSWPSVEVDVGELLERHPNGQMEVVVRFYIHSQQGADQCWRIEKELHTCMTAKRLTPENADKSFKVSRCHQTALMRLPRTPWAASIQVEYTLRVAELYPVKQNQ
jgi:hypothetical protein